MNITDVIIDLRMVYSLSLPHYEDGKKVKKKSLAISTSILIGILFFMQTIAVFAALSLEDVTTWGWGTGNRLNSVAVGDVDGDGKKEIVTGGYYSEDMHWVAQLCVWDGTTRVCEGVKTWYWIGDTRISSVAVGDVDGDGDMEIVTGGYCYGSAQLCVWDGETLVLEGVRTWKWVENTEIRSVAVGDVDGDGDMEIMTGGDYLSGSFRVAQLCVWDGETLVLEGVRTWKWAESTEVSSVAVGDVDGDGQMEIVTGGVYSVYSIGVHAQLCVWDGETLVLEGVRTWYWDYGILINSVLVGDVDGDGQMEIVTGGAYWGGPYNSQLCVWSGATLALEDVTTWYWNHDTYVWSVAIGDVDGDGDMEIVTGGHYTDGFGGYRIAQLCVWDGATLAFEDVKTWNWIGDTIIFSVAIGDVDYDGQVEIMTGGYYIDGTHVVAQLCVWA